MDDFIIMLLEGLVKACLEVFREDLRELFKSLFKKKR